MAAATRPRDVYGSTMAVTMWRTRKTTDRSARLRWRPTLRKRGHDGLCQRTTVRTPRHTTAVNSTSDTIPAPRATSHRIWSVIGALLGGRAGIYVSNKSLARPLFRFDYAGATGAGQPPTRRISPST